MENTKRMYSIRTKDIALIALFTALLAVCSWISVPTAIPFTPLMDELMLTAASGALVPNATIVRPITI